MDLIAAALRPILKPLRRTNVPDSKPTVSGRIWRAKSESRMLLHPFSIGRFNYETTVQLRAA